MEPRFRVDFHVYLLLALGMLTLPVPWLMGAFLAACVHEMCHYFVAKAMGISCKEFHIGIGGITMRMSYMTRKEELLIASAGPGGSILLFFFIRIYPQMAICALIQGLFNLLPIYPLDGGRILRCLLNKREVVCNGVECCAVLMVLCIGIVLSLRLKLGIFPVIVSLLATCKAILRKFPCKAVKLGVQ